MPAQNKLLHVVATRMFTTLMPEHTLEWLERRLEIFASFTLASLMAQTEQNFYWILLVSPNLPAAISIRLQQLTAEYANIVILPLKVADLHDQPEYAAEFTKFIQQRQLAYDFLLSSRIDGDDGWNINYVAKLQAEARRLIASYPTWQHRRGLILNFPYGQVCYPFAIRGKEGIGVWRRKFFSPSVDVLAIKQAQETLYKFPHSKTAEFAKKNNYQCQYIKTSESMWLYVQHVQNDGLLRKWHRWFILFEKFAMRFRNFRSNDLDKYGISNASRLAFKANYLAKLKSKC